MICYGRPSCDYCPDDPHSLIYGPNCSSSSTHSLNRSRIACPLYDSTRLRRPCRLRSDALYLHRALSHSTGHHGHPRPRCMCTSLAGDGAGCPHPAPTLMFSSFTAASSSTTPAAPPPILVPAPTLDCSLSFAAASMHPEREGTSPQGR